MRTKKKKAEPLTLDQWKKECAKFAQKLAHLHDILEEDDPYDLFEAMPGAFARGQSPEDFIREMFEEDLASQAYDADLVRQSAEYLEE